MAEIGTLPSSPSLLPLPPIDSLTYEMIDKLSLKVLVYYLSECELKRMKETNDSQNEL